MQYEVCEELGEGAFGRAVRVRRRRDGAALVAKIMHEGGLSDRAREEVLPPPRLPEAHLPLKDTTVTAGHICSSASKCREPVSVAHIACHAAHVHAGAGCTVRQPTPAGWCIIPSLQGCILELCSGDGKGRPDTP